MQRTSNCLAKLERMKKALRHREADRVPISDFFWGSFLKRWREELGLAADADIYRYYDLDWMQFNPNMDPHIKPFEILRGERRERSSSAPGSKPSIQKKLDLSHARLPEIRNRHDRKDGGVPVRRSLGRAPLLLRRRRPDQRRGRLASRATSLRSSIACRPPWTDFPSSAASAKATRCCGASSARKTRCCGWACIPTRSRASSTGSMRSRWKSSRPRSRPPADVLDGMVIWGDVAYKNGMLFSPAFWRKHFKPGVKALIDECHSPWLAGDLSRLRQRQPHLRGLHRNRRGRLQSAGGQGRPGRRRPAPPVRPPHGLLRQHGRAAVGQRQPRGNQAPPSSPS